MKKSDSVSELTFLFKLLPEIREMETVDKIYRLLLASPMDLDPPWLEIWL